MELIQMERGTYLQEVYQNFDYDATIWAVSCDYPDMDSGAYKRFYSGNIAPGKNYMQINDPAMDEAIMINRSSQDPAEKAAQVLKVSEIIRDEVYALPLYASPNTMAVRSDLKGVNINYGMMIDFYLWSR
jgi:ABC-type transport system substrate-binding protein